MNPGVLIVLLILAVILAMVLLLRKKRVFAGTSTTVEEIPLILERLQDTGTDGHFAAFMFFPPGRSSPKEAVNLQFSLEQFRLGLDWVLLAPSNLEGKQRFTQFATGRGHTVAEREVNNVTYLRVEDGDLAALGQAVISELYALPPGTPLDLISEGFAWP